MTVKLKDQFITKSKETRLYNLDKPVLGLTGGIGTGKSTVSKLLSKQGFFIIDADELVHDIYESKEAIDFVRSISPEAVEADGSISFQKLRELAFKWPNILKDLEQFIYQRMPHFFQTVAKQSNQDVIIYDVPLLFEKDLADKFDATITVYAPKEIQIERAMKRDHTPRDIIESIVAKQICIEEKKNQSDYVIDNSSNYDDLEVQVTQMTDYFFAQ